MQFPVKVGLGMLIMKKQPQLGQSGNAPPSTFNAARGEASPPNSS
jgi:hypothetical protein